MKKYQKILNLFLIVIVCLLIFTNTSEATYSISQLKSMYPTGMQWNDDYYGNTECHGFAGLIYDGYYGINPFSYATQVNDVNQVQAGDIVRYNGHSVFILSRNNNNVTVAECNYDWNNHVRWDQAKTINELSNNFEYVLKGPYILGTTVNPTTPQNVSVDISSGVTVNWSKATNCYAYKIEIYDSSNTKVKELEVKKQSTTSTKVYNLQTGTYNVRVYAVGRNGMLSGYGIASFSCQAEAYAFTVSPQKKVISVGESFKYNVRLTPEDGIAQIRFYAGSDTDKSIISIEENGNIVGLKEGTTKVYFNFKTSRTNFTNSYQVKVVNALKLKENEKMIYTGKTAKISLMSYSNEAEVKWMSKNTKIATVDSSGNVTAIAPGTTRISVTQTVYNSDQSDYNISSDYCTVTVVDPIQNMDFEQKYVKIKQKESVQYLPTITPNNVANYINLKWTSSNPSAVTVDSNGKVTGVGNGISVITASYDNFSASYTVESRENYFVNKVISRKVDKIIDFDLGELFDGAELETGEIVKVHWTSNNEKVVSVFSNGTRYKANIGGFATLTATDERYGTATYIIFVNEPVINTNTSKIYAGDLNGNYKFDQGDIDILVKVINGEETSTDIMKLSDINGDGVINVLDKEVLEDIVVNDRIQLDVHILATSVKLGPDTQEIYLSNGSARPTFNYTIYPENSENKIAEWVVITNKVKEDGTFENIIETSSSVRITEPGTYSIMAVTDNNIDSNIVKLIVKEEKTLKGDVNGDGKVTMFDCSEILLHVKKIKLLTAEEIQRGDINGDGKLTMFDCSEILLHVKKIKLLF